MTAKSSTWVMLRGLTREKAHWGQFPQLFQGAIENSRILLPDLPGAGSEREHSAPTLIESYTEDLRRRISVELVKAEGPKFLFGISMGGMIAMDWLQRYPDDFCGAVLLNTSSSNIGRAWERFRFAALPALLLNLFDPSLKRRERAIVDLVVNNRDLRAKVAEAWVEIQRKAPTHRVNMFRQMLAAARFRPKLEQIKRPVLLLASSQDRLVDHQISLRLKDKIRNSVIAIHPNAGHDLPIDAPDWICEQVKRWLADLGYAVKR
jgi:pimeloyl-ACP methyl ester carboxylesterase